MNRIFRSILALAASLWACSTALGQPNSKGDSADAPRANTTGTTVKEVEPSIFYLPDDEGKLQPVLNFRLSDFTRLLELEKQYQAIREAPKYRLEKLTIEGTVNGEIADLSARLQIVVSAEGDVRVPLRMGKVVLAEQPKFQGPGECTVSFDDNAGEFVAWFKGGSKEPQFLTLHLLAPVNKGDGVQTLSLSAPRATNSEMKLAVSAPELVANVSPGSVIASRQTNGDQTTFQVLGLGSDFTISWQKADRPIAEVPLSLDVSGVIEVRVEQGGIHSEAKLSVRSFAKEFDTFQVRLPPRAQLVQGPSDEFTISPVLEPARDEKSQGALLQVQLKNKTQGPFSLRLVAEQPLKETLTDSLQLAGFDVPGAVRQWGIIAVRNVGDWKITWGDLIRAHRIDELPAEIRREDLVAGFEYFGPAVSLPATIERRVSRTQVATTHYLQVSPERLNLTTTLPIRVSGAKIFQLEIDLSGWSLDAIEPATLMDENEIVLGGSESVTIPFAKGISGNTRLTLKAHRDFDPSTGKIDFALPSPKVSVMADPLLAIEVAPGVTLIPAQTPDLKKILLSDWTGEKLFGSPQQVQIYRLSKGAASISGSVQLASSRHPVAVASRAFVNAKSVTVEQQFTFKSSSNDASRGRLQFPLPWSQMHGLTAQLDDTPIELTPVQTTDDQPFFGSRFLASLPLGNGEHVLMIRYSVQDLGIVAGVTTDISLPLIMPYEMDITKNELTLVPQSGVSVGVLSDEWQVLGRSENTDDSAPIVMTSESAPLFANLAVGLQEDTAMAGTIVERAWLQTWLGDTGRQDRLTMRLVTAEREIRLRIPEGVVAATVTLDGKRVSINAGIPSQELTIAVPQAHDPEKPLVLEARYRFAQSATSGTALQIEPPALLNDQAWVQRSYWQLITPSSLHLANRPGSVVDESTWTWKGYFWGRDPLLSQRDLEAWASSSRDPDFAYDANEYLFSTLGALPQTISIRLINQGIMITLASGLALLAGLLMVYVPFFRKGGILFLLGIGTATASAFAPTLTMLALQAGIVGVVLAALSGFIAKLIARPARYEPSNWAGTSSIVESGVARKVGTVSTQTAAVVEYSPAEGSP